MSDKRSTAHAHLSMGGTYHYNHRTEDAIREYATALTLFTELEREAPTPDAKRDLAVANNCMVIAYCQLMDYETAGRYASNGLKYRIEVEAMTHSVDDRRELGHAYQTMGDIAIWCSNDTLGERYYKNALEVKEELLAVERSDLNIDSAADSCGRLGLVLLRRGDNPGARHYYLRGIELFSALSPANEYKRRNGMAWMYIGIRNTYMNEGNYPEAEKANLEAIRLRRLLAEADYSVRNRIDLAIALREMGIVGYHECNEAKAMPYYEESLEVIETLADENDGHEVMNELAVTYNAYAGALERFGAREVAIEYLAKCIEIRRDLLVKQDSPNFRHELAYAYYRMAETERANEARAVLPLAIEIWTDLVRQYPYYGGWLTAAKNLLATL